MIRSQFCPFIVAVVAVAAAVVAIFIIIIIIIIIIRIYLLESYCTLILQTLLYSLLIIFK